MDREKNYFEIYLIQRGQESQKIMNKLTVTFPLLLERDLVKEAFQASTEMLERMLKRKLLHTNHELRYIPGYRHQLESYFQ
jgi:hypothetical protein